MSRPALLVLIVSVLFVNGELNENSEVNPNDLYRPQIWSLLNYLNSNSERIYNYNRGTLIDIKKQDGDVTDLTVDVQVDCIRKEPETPCVTSILTCQGSVQYVPTSMTYETLSGVSCNPKKTVKIPSADEREEHAAEVFEDNVKANDYSKPIELSYHEVTSPNTEEQFVAVRPTSHYCVGCPVDLDTDVEGISVLIDAALKQVETERTRKQALVKVLRVQQQVVAGVKYILLLEIAPTICSKTAAVLESCPVDVGYSSEICEINYLQRPWINNNKYIIGNNCTVSQQYTSPEQKLSESNGNDIDNEVDVHNYNGKRMFSADSKTKIDVGPNFDKIAESGQMEDAISPGHLAELESQILFKRPTNLPVTDTFAEVPTENIHSTQQEFMVEGAAEISSRLFDTPTTLEASDLTEEQKSILDEMLFDDQPATETTRDDNVSSVSKDSTAKKCSEGESKQEDLSKKIVKRQVGGRQSISTDSPIINELLGASLLHLNQESAGNTKYKITEVISASQQIVAGSLYRIKVRISQSDCSKDQSTDPKDCQVKKNGDQRICSVKVWDRPWLPNGRETNITCEGDDNAYSFRSKRSLSNGSQNDDDEQTVQLLFDKFVNQYGKVYKHKREYEFRLRIFRENLKTVDDLNRNEQGTARYGPTKFADLTPEEFRRNYLGLRPDLKNENEIEFSKAKIPDVHLPNEFDWRSKKAVSEVKDQGQCGSCWAFSVTGNVEGQYAIKHGQLLEFSEQELVDCDTQDQGCNGGLMDNAYRAIEKLGGLETERDYPYDAEDEKCHFNGSLTRVQLSGALNISTDEVDMAKWLVANGPISVGINANAMQFYVGGVSHPWKVLCNPKNLDHGVLIVGYGVHTYPMFKKTLPYWIVKNSWGKSWGEQGYYRVYRGDGTCGINQMPSSAIVE